MKTKLLFRKVNEDLVWISVGKHNFVSRPGVTLAEFCGLLLLRLR